MNYPIVKITWRDANMFSREHKLTEVVKEFKICVVVSIGFLVGYDKENPIISREYMTDNRSVRGSIVIPKENIVEMITVSSQVEVSQSAPNKKEA